MIEKRIFYEVEDSIENAIDMLGKGYHDEPAAIIEEPRRRIVLRDELSEEKTYAWVKLSTAFKPHIKELKGSSLAVWLFISLSINDNGIAFPSIATIANETGYSRQGVMDAIAILEEKGYMKVRRNERRYNLYEPEFASIGKGKEPKLVNSVDQLSQVETPKESSVLDLNQSNQKKPELTRAEQIQQAQERIAKQRASKKDPLDYLQENATQIAAVEGMRRRIETALKLNLEREWDLPKSDWHGYDKLLLRRENETGQTIEKFMEWYNGDDFRRKSDMWLKPGKIEQLWGRAFENSEPEEDLYPTL